MDIKIACEAFRKAAAACDAAEKIKEQARAELIALTGSQPFAAHGVTITVIPGKASVDWTLAAPALGITPEMTAPFTKTRAGSLRVSADREIAL